MVKRGRKVKAVKKVVKTVKSVRRMTNVFEPDEQENVHYKGEPKGKK